MTGTVVVVGSLNLDLVVGLERMPDPGETVLGSRLERHPGGKGLNQAVAAARLGASVAMIGAIGSDEAGAWLRGVAEAEGVDVSHVVTLEGPSGTAVIEVDASSQNRIVVVPGANAGVQADVVTSAIAALASQGRVAVVLTQGEVPMTAIEAALRAGRAAGATTILNPAPALDYPDTIIALADILVPNEHEAAVLTDEDCSTTVGVTEAARALVDKGAGTVVVTRGARGLQWSTATTGGSLGAFRVTAIDTVAAGDAFCGGLATALAGGESFADALRRASAAGALAASRRGAVPSLPTVKDVDAMLDLQAE